MGFELWINSWPNDGFFFYFIWKTWIAQGEPWSFVQQVYLALIQSVACWDDTIIKICLMDVNKPQASAERPAIFTPNECSCLVTANKQPGQAVQNILISIFQTSSSESSTLGYNRPVPQHPWPTDADQETHPALWRLVTQQRSLQSSRRHQNTPFQPASSLQVWTVCVYWCSGLYAIKLANALK